MKTLEPILAIALATLAILFTVQKVGHILAASLDELHVKLDAIQRKLEDPDEH